MGEIKNDLKIGMREAGGRKKFDKAMNLAKGDVGGDRVLSIKGVVTS